MDFDVYIRGVVSEATFDMKHGIIKSAADVG
jgi:hypothetical protein